MQLQALAILRNSSAGHMVSVVEPLTAGSHQYQEAFSIHPTAAADTAIENRSLLNKIFRAVLI